MIDPKRKFQLFKQNKHFCSAPWNLLYVATDGKIQTCAYGKNFGDLLENTLEEIVINDNYQQLRNDILQDKITDNCKKCLSLGNNVHGKAFNDVREHYNKLSIKSSVDYTDTKQFKLSAVDLHWSSICDLKCITCWSKQSSSIAREQNQPVLHTPTHIADSIIEYIVESQDEIKEIYLSGGEPTLIKYNLKLLKQIEKRHDLCLRINSNLQWNENNPIIKEILKFPNVMFTCSIDGMNNTFNYIRRGGNWNTFVKNLDYLKQFNNVKLRGNTVFFVLTAQELPMIIDFMIENYQSVDHTINLISMEKDHMRSRNLPDHVKEQVKINLNSALEKYKDNLSISGGIVNCLSELEYPKTDNYHDYLDQIDSMAGTNWKNLFPDLI